MLWSCLNLLSSFRRLCLTFVHILMEMILSCNITVALTKKHQELFSGHGNCLLILKILCAVSLGVYPLTLRPEKKTAGREQSAYQNLRSCAKVFSRCMSETVLLHSDIDQTLADWVIYLLSLPTFFTSLMNFGLHILQIKI